MEMFPTTANAVKEVVTLIAVTGIYCQELKGVQIETTNVSIVTEVQSDYRKTCMLFYHSSSSSYRTDPTAHGASH